MGPTRLAIDTGSWKINEHFPRLLSYLIPSQTRFYDVAISRTSFTGNFGSGLKLLW